MCVISTLLKALFNPAWKLAFATQNVEPDSTLCMVRLPTKLWYQVHTHLHVGPSDFL